MADQPTDVRITDNRTAHRYEARVGDAVAAYAIYDLTADAIVFEHTKTDPRFEGRGVASRLARAALDDVRARGLRVLARCPFIASYIERHPAYADLVDAAS